MCDELMYLINDCDGLNKPFIENYLRIKKNIEDILSKNVNVNYFEQDLMDVAYDFDFLVEIVNNDDTCSNIINLIKEIESHIDINIYLINEQIEDSILDNEEFITFDIYCNIK